MIEIKTKFDIGQKAWFIYKNKAVKYPIHSMDIAIGKNSIKNTICFYIELKGDTNLEIIDEAYCHSTREQLIDSL